MGRIAITGIGSFLGARFLRRLAELHPADGLVALDIAVPPAALGVRHHRIDFTVPGSDQQLLDALREEQVDTVAHLAFFTGPQRDTSYAHELESIGTLNLLAAAAAAGVTQVLMRSFTALYGARGQNPSFLTEERPLPADAPLAWMRDKLEAEQHAAQFARRYPGMCVSVLRLAPLFGPGVRTFYTRLFDNRVVPVLMGYDPLVQLLHPDDALRALETGLERRAPGVFNVVPRASVSLLTALLLSGKLPVAVPHPVAYLAADLMWAAGLGVAPGGFVDYGRYLFVADGQKAARVLGFEALYDSRASLDAYLAWRYPRRLGRRREEVPA